MSLCLSNPSAPRTRPALRLLAFVGLLALLLGLGRSARAEFKLTLDQKDGDKISDVAKLVAHADSSDGIDKVEFYVDDQLRFTATGVPYTYKWDTIPDPEGKHAVTVTAYDSNGQTKKAALSLVIDNTLDLGASALAKKAHEALAANDADTATNYSRRALKAEPGNVEAERVIAALAAKDSDWDTAVSSLEKSKGLDQNTGAMKELAGYKMRRLMMPDNVATFIPDLQGIVDLRQKSADMVVAQTKAKDPQDHDAIGNALLRAGHPREAQLEFQKINSPTLTVTNRLALAYILDGQPETTVTNLRVILREKTGDAVTREVMGLAQLRLHQFSEAKTTVQPDLAAGLPAAQIIAAYADIALGNPALALTEAQKAVEAVPDAGDARFALSMATRNLADSETELVKTFTLSPFESGPYLDYAARLALQKKNDRYDDAVKLTDFILKREPDNVPAKTIAVLLYLQKNNFKDAEPILDGLSQHDTSPDVQMTVSVYFNLKQNVNQADKYLELARKQDPLHFDQLIPPTPGEYLLALVRRYHYRANFFLTLDSLYAAKAALKVDPADPAQ